MHYELLAALTVLLAVASVAPAGDDPDAKAIDGTWLPESAELAGNEFPPQVRKSIKLMLEGGKYTATVGEQRDEGTVKRDPSKSPKTMIISGTEGPNKGKTFLAIYELKEDTLKVCYDLSGKAYPEEFKTKPGTQLYLVTYKREKP